MEDTSLDDFVDADAEAADAEGGADEGTDVGAVDDEGGVNDGAVDDGDAHGDEEDESGANEAVDPAVSTMGWSADPTACERCGERVHRRWRDEGALVCGACKPW